jgi:hypothetical protein
MNSAEERNNIVNLGRRDSAEPRDERLGDLLANIRGISSRQLVRLIGNMFDNVDDALFDLAEKAENNAVQTQFFDGMRNVRKTRPLMERRYLDQVTRGFSRLASGYRHESSEESSHARLRNQGTEGSELSLVEERDLEESLAVTSMISKSESRLGQLLLAVNQRMTVICAGHKVDNADNPIGPAALARAFGEAMNELDVEVRVKLIVYKLYERYVLSGLDELYQDISQELVNAGVLPQLRTPEIRRSNATAGSRRRRPEGATDPYANDPESIGAELVQTLQSLLAERRQNSRMGSQSGAAYAGPSLSPAELLGALSVLQGEVARNTAAMPVEIPSDTTLSAEDVRLLKEQLVHQISHLRGEAKSKVSGPDEDTIDLVSMLFEYILEDHNLPMEMQVLLARLQIPYLKAAILDRRLFAQPDHPARLLLDELAEAAKSWSVE